MALFSTSGKSFRERKIRYVLKRYLKLQPKNLDLYYQAVVHTSYKEANEGSDYERLEFLGDALLGSYVATWLYDHYPNKNEGQLSRSRSKLISRKFLNKLAFKLRINHLIYFSTREDLSENSIPGNTLEALLGAIYVDRGPKVLKDTLDYIFSQHIDVEEVERQEVDYKSKLVQFCQKNKIRPQFKIADQSHKKGRDYFTITLQVAGYESVTSHGYSKKKAEQQASKKFLNSLAKPE